jgi:hypothetical protein
MKSKKKKQNKKTTQKLFEERTGVKYQNWLQAWGVTLKQQRDSVKVVVPYATETTTQSYEVIKWTM